MLCPIFEKFRPPHPLRPPHTYTALIFDQLTSLWVGTIPYLSDINTSIDIWQEAITLEPLQPIRVGDIVLMVP